MRTSTVLRAAKRPFLLLIVGLNVSVYSAEIPDIRLLRTKAEQGDAKSQLALGYCYDWGQGVVKDEKQAVMWYRRAADQGLAEAQRCLGSCLISGNGASKNATEGVIWLRKAANQGDAKAQAALGGCYLAGNGVSKDVIQGYVWLSLAANKESQAAQVRDELAKHMTPQELSEARRLVSGTMKQRQDVAISSSEGSTFNTGLNLNSLTRKEFVEFSKEIYKEFKADPQSAAEKAKQIIIGMAGLEDKPQMHGLFEVDCVFNVNTMLMLVACGNRIKREEKIVQEYQQQSSGVRSKLKTEEQRILLDTFTALLVSQQKEL